MAWTAPMTAVANATFTAAQFNTHVRDNLLETAPAKAANAGGYFVATGTNAIAERRGTSALTDPGTPDTRTSTSYGDMTNAGPAVTVTTGTRALVTISCEAVGGSGDAATSESRMSFAVSGATTIAATDAVCACRTGADTRFQLSRTVYLTTLIAGSNTFTAKYRVSAGTTTFSHREINVLPF
jgi:hypothetical protein